MSTKIAGTSNKRSKWLRLVAWAGVLSGALATGYFGLIGQRGAETTLGLFEDPVQLHAIPDGALRSETYSLGDTGVVIPRPLRDIPPPPSTDSPQYAEKFDRWLSSMQGVRAGGASVSFVVERTAPDAAYITDVRVRVLKRDEPLAGTHIAPNGAGGVNVRTALFDLDSPKQDPQLLPSDSTGEKWSFPLRVQRGDEEFFSVWAYSSTDYVSWVVELDYVVDGKQSTTTIDDDGQPFSSTATTATTESTRLPLTGEPWPPPAL